MRALTQADRPTLVAVLEYIRENEEFITGAAQEESELPPLFHQVKEILESDSLIDYTAIRQALLREEGEVY